MSCGTKKNIYFSVQDFSPVPEMKIVDCEKALKTANLFYRQRAGLRGSTGN